MGLIRKSNFIQIILYLPVRCFFVV